MINTLLTKVIGSKNERMLKKLHPIVDQINALEAEIEALDDAALVAKGDEFRKRAEAGETLDDLLPEAFAVVLKFAGRRGPDWHWRLGRLDHFKLRLAHGLFFRGLHPLVPEPDFDASRTSGESAEVEARCYTRPRKK